MLVPTTYFIVLDRIVVLLYFANQDRTIRQKEFSTKGKDGI
jgi:hypothetical protein